MIVVDCLLNSTTALVFGSNSRTNMIYMICQECIMGLLNSKTIIYVTHQVEFLPAADLILVSCSSLNC